MDKPSFFRVIGHKLRHRPDLVAGLLVLIVGTSALVAIACAPLGPVFQAVLVVVGVTPIVAVVLGMFYDYADMDHEAASGDPPQAGSR